MNGPWPAIAALALIAAYWVGWHMCIWHHKVEVPPVVWPWRAYKGTHTQANPQPPETPIDPDEYGRHAVPVHTTDTHHDDPTHTLKAAA